MKQENKELVKLTIKQILLSFLDITAGMIYLCDLRHIHKKSLAEYRDWRLIDYQNFKDKVHYLKRKKLINIIIRNKNEYLIPTNKAKDKIKRYFLYEFKIKEFAKWDGKWRVIIFDIPNDKKIEREQFRKKLLNLGFLKLQESVFVYPFDCQDEINFLKKIFYLKPYVQFLLVETIETEKDLFKHFLKNKILDKKKCVTFFARAKNVTKKNRTK